MSREMKTILGSITGVALLLGLALSTLNSVGEVKESLGDYKVEVANKYVSNTSLRDLKIDMDKRFDRIEDLIRRGSRSTRRTGQ